MKKISILLSAAILTSTLSLVPTQASASHPLSVDGQALPSLAPMLDVITPAVVSVRVEGTHEVAGRGSDPFSYLFGNRRGQQRQER